MAKLGELRMTIAPRLDMNAMKKVVSKMSGGIKKGLKTAGKIGSAVGKAATGMNQGFQLLNIIESLLNKAGGLIKSSNNTADEWKDLASAGGEASGDMVSKMLALSERGAGVDVTQQIYEKMIRNEDTGAQLRGHEQGATMAMMRIMADAQQMRLDADKLKANKDIAGSLAKEKELSDFLEKYGVDRQMAKIQDLMQASYQLVNELEHGKVTEEEAFGSREKRKKLTQNIEAGEQINSMVAHQQTVNAVNNMEEIANQGTMALPLYQAQQQGALQLKDLQQSVAGVKTAMDTIQLVNVGLSEGVKIVTKTISGLKKAIEGLMDAWNNRPWYMGGGGGGNDKPKEEAPKGGGTDSDKVPGS